MEFLNQKELVFPVSGKRESKKVQEFLFKLGVTWLDNTTEVIHNEGEKFLFYAKSYEDNWEIAYSEELDSRFINVPRVKITNSEIEIISKKFKRFDYVYLAKDKDLSDAVLYIILSSNKINSVVRKAFDLDSEGIILPTQELIYAEEIKDNYKDISRGSVFRFKTNFTSGVSGRTRGICSYAENSNKINLYYKDKHGFYDSSSVPFTEIVLEKVAELPSNFSVGDTLLKVSEDSLNYQNYITVNGFFPKKYTGWNNDCLLYGATSYTHFDKNLHIRFTQIESSNRLASASLLTKFIKIRNVSKIKDKDLVPLMESLIESTLHISFDKTSLRNFTINSSKELTYLPVGKDPEITGSGNWTTKNRQSGKYGKLFRKLLNQVGCKKYEDRHIEKLVNLLKSNLSDGEFRVISGKEITEIYTNPKIASRVGCLSDSCMNNKPASFFEIYEDNAEMLIMENHLGKLLGRALLWNTSCGKKLMDRVYASDANTNCFLDWARENGYWYKNCQSYSTPDEFRDSKGEFIENKNLRIDLNKYYEQYPYMDTFKYTNNLYDYIGNNPSENNYELDSTGGDLNGNLGCDYCFDDVEQQ